MAPGIQDATKNPKFRRKTAEERRRQLIDVAIKCLAEGGLAACTIDRICREAGVSRGLINHHFTSKEALLTAVYETMTHYLAKRPHLRSVESEATALEGLTLLIEYSFRADGLGPDHLKAWLALWGEVPGNSYLLKLHRERYEVYHKSVTQAFTVIARERDREVNAGALAVTLIALIDGLWLEWCMDPSVLSAEAAKTACYDLIATHLGSIKR